MTETRIEEDLLGSKEVPIGAYYGVHTVRAMENFRISSAKISDVPAMVRGMVMVKKASAMDNKEMFTIPADVADAISPAATRCSTMAAAWTSSPSTSSRVAQGPR